MHIEHLTMFGLSDSIPPGAGGKWDRRSKELWSSGKLTSFSAEFSNITVLNMVFPQEFFVAI